VRPLETRDHAKPELGLTFAHTTLTNDVERHSPQSGRNWGPMGSDFGEAWGRGCRLVV
jgi:hypothetical protein